MLALQRSAGNRAVAGLLQRAPIGTDQPAARPRPYMRYASSSVAIAPMEDLYEGKCDAKFDLVAVRRSWSRGLTGKDVTLSFECGPATFAFTTYVPWFDDRFPWSMRTVKGEHAFVEEEISKALDTIGTDIDDPGARWWEARRTITNALSIDVRNYCGP